MERNVAQRRRLAVGVVLAMTVAMFALSSPSGADVTAVQGSAYGYQTNVGLFGGPPAIRGFGQPVTAPETASSPSVTLPATGGNVSQSDPNGASGQYGPAVIFGGRWPDAAPSAPPSGPISTDCTGTTGAGGSVTCNAAVTLYSPPPPAAPGGIGPGPIVADEARSTCTARETDPVTGAKSITGGATFVNGVLETKYDANTQLPIETEPIPANPPVNYTRTGTIDHVGDSYSVVFNEQITNPDGSLTVNAVHMTLLGPIAVGELIIGSVTCGLTTVEGTTTTTEATTTTIEPTTTTEASTTTTEPTTTSSSTSSSTTSSTMSTTTSSSTSTTEPTTTTSSSTTSSSTSTTEPTTTSSSTSTTAPTTTSSSTTSTTAATTTTTEAPTTTSSSTTSTTAATTTTTEAPTTTSSSTTSTTAATTTTTEAPTTTTTTPPIGGGIREIIRQLVCSIIRPLVSLPFLGPFLQRFLTAFGC